MNKVLKYYHISADDMNTVFTNANSTENLHDKLLRAEEYIQSIGGELNFQFDANDGNPILKLNFLRVPDNFNHVINFVKTYASRTMELARSSTHGISVIIDMSNLEDRINPLQLAGASVQSIDSNNMLKQHDLVKNVVLVTGYEDSLLKKQAFTFVERISGTKLLSFESVEQATEFINSPEEP